MIWLGFVGLLFWFGFEFFDDLVLVSWVGFFFLQDKGLFEGLCCHFLSMLHSIWEKEQIISHTSCEDLCLQGCVPVKITPKELIYENCVHVEQET